MEPSAHERLTAARARIAAACLHANPSPQLGSVTLRPHQQLLASRARRVLREYGGCLIADDVGRGKTFVSLAVTAPYEHRLIVAPSALRAAWTTAIARTGLAGTVWTHDLLSRGRAPLGKSFGVIIVDESHHFRTPGIRRYAALSELARHAPLVMLSATPVQNRIGDLRAQVALFLGDAADDLPLDALLRLVVRGHDEDDDLLPRIAPPEWLSIGEHDDAVLDAVLAFPTPVHTRDGGDEGVLRTIALVRAWASSRAALKATVRRRQRLATALEQGLGHGMLPSRTEARAWQASGDAVQLGLAALLVNDIERTDAPELIERLRVEACRLQVLSDALRTTPDPDVARVAALRELRHSMPHARILAFSEFASTVTHLYACMRADSGVGMLSSRNARIASGAIPRAELLQRFAPCAQRGTRFRVHEQVTLLLTTDLLSEGLDLQDASVVVHLDLPWNPARLRQRLGRIRRPGGAATVRSFFLAPPARAARLLDVERRLRMKEEVSHGATARTTPALPVLSTSQLVALDASARASPLNAADRGVIALRLAEWASHAPVTTGLALAATEASVHGWLACLSDGTLVSTADIRAAVSACQSPARTPASHEIRSALEQLTQWLEHQRIDVLAGAMDFPGAARHELIARARTIAHSVSRQHRPDALALVATLSNKLRLPLPLGTEHELRRMAGTIAGEQDPVNTLRALVACAVTHASAAPPTSFPVALIVFGTSTATTHNGASLAADPVVLRW